MLVIRRRVDEKIQLGDNIVITVLDIDRGRVKLGIAAPRDVLVLRTELLEHPPDLGHLWRDEPAGG